MTQTTQVKRGNYLLPIIITFALFFMIAHQTTNCGKWIVLKKYSSSFVKLIVF